jgi:hypothetical protein
VLLWCTFFDGIAGGHACYLSFETAPMFSQCYLFLYPNIYSLSVA